MFYQGHTTLVSNVMHKVVCPGWKIKGSQSVRKAPRVCDFNFYFSLHIPVSDMEKKHKFLNESQWISTEGLIFTEK